MLSARGTGRPCGRARKNLSPGALSPGGQGASAAPETQDPMRRGALSPGRLGASAGRRRSRARLGAGAPSGAGAPRRAGRLLQKPVPPPPGGPRGQGPLSHMTHNGTRVCARVSIFAVCILQNISRGSQGTKTAPAPFLRARNKARARTGPRRARTSRRCRRRVASSYRAVQALY